MPDGRARFSVVSIPEVDVPPDCFMLTTRRGKQFNSMTYGQTDPITGGTERDVILLDERDMRELGIRDGEQIIVRSEHALLYARARPGPCRRRHAQGYWPECNALLGRRYDPVSGEPEYAAVVKVERA
jgi:anaerobic selenocysteine-containing dehydrogenase